MPSLAGGSRWAEQPESMEVQPSCRGTSSQPLRGLARRAGGGNASVHLREGRPWPNNSNGKLDACRCKNDTVASIRVGKTEGD